MLKTCVKPNQPTTHFLRINVNAIDRFYFITPPQQTLLVSAVLKLFCFLFSGVSGLENVQDAFKNGDADNTVDKQTDGQHVIAKRGSPYKRLPAWSVYYGKRSADAPTDLDSYSEKDDIDADSKVPETENTSDFDEYDKVDDIVSKLSKRPSFKRLHSWISTYGKRSAGFGQEDKIDSLDSSDEDSLDAIELLKNEQWPTPNIDDFYVKFGAPAKRIPGWSATYGKRIPGWSATYGKRMPGWSATYGKRSSPYNMILAGYGEGMPSLSAYNKRAPMWSATYGKRIPGWAATYGKRALWQAVYGKRSDNRMTFADQIAALREHLNSQNSDKNESKRTQAWSAFYGR